MKIIHLKEVDSTNNFLKNLCKSQTDLGPTAIVAETQTAGRGQMGTMWQDEPGASLLLSIGFEPFQLHVKNQFYVSMANALAGLWFLEALGVRASIKWPNDLWVNRKKIAGILIENSIFNNQISQVVAGIGININQTAFSENFSATSVMLETGTNWPTNSLADIFIKHWEKAIGLLQNKNFDALQTLYFQNLIGYQKIETYQNSEGQFQASIIGLDASGRLILKKTNGTKQVFDLKEVRLVP